MQKYYLNEHKLYGVYSRKNLPKIKDVAYLINLNKYQSVGTHWIASYVMAIIWVHFTMRPILTPLKVNIF